MTREPLLVAAGVSATRGDRTLFRDLALDLAAGEAAQIGGPNGSGKTTLLRILCGLGLPCSGTVQWRGVTIARSRSRFLAELAYIGHQPGIKEDLSALENLRLAELCGRHQPDWLLEQALERVGLGRLIDEPARCFSAGQRRRLALARLLVGEARLWVLDEPYTALDSEGIDLVRNLLEQHLSDGGAMVLTSHQPLELGEGRLQSIRLAA